MARKNTKGKPTRKDIDTAIQNIGKKIEFLEGYAKSTEVALDLYIKFKKDDKAFTKRVEEFNKEMEKKAEEEKKLANKEKTD